MQNYRKIWESYYGPIPYDEFGRRMEIHHIDGNRNNNEISNLSCISIQEHYNIHYSNSDWAACQSIANRMNISHKEKSKISSELASKRVKEGTHHFTDPEFIKKDSIRKSHRNKGSGNPMYGKVVSNETKSKRSTSHKKLVENNLHYLQSEEHKTRMRMKAKIELEQGIHVFQKEETILKSKESHKKMLQDKVHPFNKYDRVDPNKIKMYCKFCNKETTLPAFNRFHKH